MPFLNRKKRHDILDIIPHLSDPYGPVGLGTLTDLTISQVAGLQRAYSLSHS